MADMMSGLSEQKKGPHMWRIHIEGDQCLNPTQINSLGELLLITPLLENTLRDELDGLDRRISRRGQTTFEGVVMAESGSGKTSSGHFHGYSHYLEELQSIDPRHDMALRSAVDTFLSEQRFVLTFDSVGVASEILLALQEREDDSAVFTRLTAAARRLLPHSNVAVLGQEWQYINQGLQ